MEHDNRDLLKKLTLKKYNEMIEWANTQKKTRYPYESLMEDEIKKGWHGDDCPYCMKYYDVDPSDDDIEPCRECPLNVHKHKYSVSCCKGLWKKMDEARTWKSWIKYAEKIVEFVKENG